jgi:hypothetical protein
MGGVFKEGMACVGILVIEELGSICVPNVNGAVHIGVSSIEELISVDTLTGESISGLTVGELVYIGASTIKEPVSVNTQASTMCLTTGSTGTLNEIKGQLETMSFIKDRPGLWFE